jgi:hypothetical protein
MPEHLSLWGVAKPLAPARYGGIFRIVDTNFREYLF